MNTIKKIWNAHREVLSYLFFGGLTTVVNIVAYWLFARMGLPTAAANAVALAVSIAFAYITNRRWVFASGSRGAAFWQELASFVGCRLATGVLDEIIMILGVDVLGPMVVAPAQSEIWGLAIKVFSNVLVILANYVFSKYLIFRKRKG